MIDKHPALIARCTGVDDVISAVNFARAKKLLMSRTDKKKEMGLPALVEQITSTNLRAGVR